MERRMGGPPLVLHQLGLGMNPREMLLNQQKALITLVHGVYIPLRQSTKKDLSI